MKILVLGKDGQVGWELQRSLLPLGEIIALGREGADFENPEQVTRAAREIAPDAIVNAAAYTAVDKAESDSDRAQRVNAEAVGMLARYCRDHGAWLVHYSTDYVFDGRKPAPYVEHDAPAPLSVYGRTKLAGERAIRENVPAHLILRTSWVYAARGSNFAKTMLRLSRERDMLTIVADQHGAPTSAELIADVTALALYRVSLAPSEHAVAGTYHLAAAGETTWCDYARFVVARALENGVALKATPDKINPIATRDFPTAAMRPANSRLDTRKLQRTFGLTLPDWRAQVRRTVDELTLEKST